MNERNYQIELEKAYLENKDFDYLKLQDKVILFTGACGLIGRYFVDFVLYVSSKLNLNVKIIALEKNPDVLDLLYKYKEYINQGKVIPITQDVTKSFNIDGEIDFIIHAASPANPFWFANYPVDVINANVNGTLNMLNLAKEKNAKFLFISSGEVYGMQNCPDYGYVESQPGIVDSSIVRSCYTESKRCSETLTISFGYQYHIDVNVARLCYIYGPTYSPNETRVIFQFINNYLNNEDIVMKSNGEQVRSYLYVSDGVMALLNILVNGSNSEVYNVSSYDAVSIKDIARTISELSNGNLKVIFELPKEDEKKGFSKFMMAIQNPEKLISIGYSPKVSFKEGIKRTIDVLR